MAKFAQQVTIASKQAPITDTGYRGYLKWVQRELPAVYNKMAPQLPMAKNAFSDYTQSTVINMRKRAGRMAQANRHRHIGDLGDDSDGSSVALDASDLNTVSAFDPTNLGISSDVTSALNAVPSSTDATSIANTGTGATTTSNILSSLFNGAASIMTTQAGLQTASQINAIQLARAQAGLPPLNLSASSTGIPLISGIASNPETLLLIGGAVLLFMMMGKKSAS